MRASVARAPGDAAPADDGWRDVCGVDEVSRANARRAVRVDGRHLALVRAPPPSARLHAIDATCYHMGAPLLRAEIEDVPGRGACAVCPWHRYRIQLTTGERVYADSNGNHVGMARKQRVHEVREDRATGRVLVRLSRDEAAWESDRYAMKAPAPASAGTSAGPRSGRVFAAGRGGAMRARGEFDRLACGPLARTRDVRAMVAETMRGGDGVAPWAMTGSRGDSSSGAFGASAMRARRVRKKVTFSAEGDGASEDDGDGIEESEGG